MRVAGRGGGLSVGLARRRNSECRSSGIGSNRVGLSILPKDPGKVAAAVEHTNELNAIVLDSIEDDVVARGKPPHPFTKLGACFCPKRKSADHFTSLLDQIDCLIGDSIAITCELFPNR